MNESAVATLDVFEQRSVVGFTDGLSPINI